MTTIFAPLTSINFSSVTVVRISGSQTKNILYELTKKNNFSHQRSALFKIIDPQNNQQLDEALITYFQGPNSFTGDDVAEISLHASPFIVKRFCDILAQFDNCRLAEPGEFSKIAFLNGKMDLTQAESIVDLIAAETELQHQQSIKQLSGKLGEIYDDWTKEIINITSLIEAAIDFPDEDLPQDIIDDVEERINILKNDIKHHLDDNKTGQKIKDGLKLAIIGAPNAGKSSLINYLAKSEVAIVSDIAGTTRDAIDVHLNIGGAAVKITDTAGIRDTDDEIEKLGIAKAIARFKESDLKIYLIDASKPVIQKDFIDDNTILVVNKNDLLNNMDNVDFVYDIAISLKNGYNLDKFFAILCDNVQKLIPNQNHNFITRQRYRDSLNLALEYLENFSLDTNIEFAAEDLRLAGIEIGKITGKFGVEEILDVIFSKFCIGK